MPVQVDALRFTRTIGDDIVQVQLLMVEAVSRFYGGIVFDATALDSGTGMVLATGLGMVAAAGKLSIRTDTHWGAE